MFVPANAVSDKVFWALTADGEYSVKSGVALLQGYGLHPPAKVPFSWIWQLDIPPKIKFFLWKICQNGLPTKKRLESSHVFLPLECVFCDFHAESDHHLFLDCPFSKDVLESLIFSSVPISLPSAEASSSFVDYLCSIKYVCGSHQMRIIAVFWWFIWYARNQLVFRQDPISPRSVVEMIKTFMNKLNKVEMARCGEDLISSSPVCGHSAGRDAVAWVRPPAQFAKLNIDGSVLKNGSASYGFVLRDDEGKVLLSGASSIPPDLSILVAEAWGLREGIRGALFLGVKNIIIEGDNLSVIQAIKRV